MLKRLILLPGFDHYPLGVFSSSRLNLSALSSDTRLLGFNCSTPSIWRDIVTTWRSYHESTNPEEPFFIPE